MPPKIGMPREEPPSAQESSPQTYIKSLSDFDETSSANTGGVTGSRAVIEKRSRKKYQLKSPITQQPLFRRFKAAWRDHENFGEFIASRLAQCLSPPGFIPNVYLVDHGNGHGIGIASEYLSLNARTLNDVFGHERPPNTHVQFICGVPSPNASRTQVNLNADPVFKKKLADAIAISALVLDHDVNPGNMLLTNPDDHHSLARIDFGHAFSDLLRGGPLIAGSRTHENPVVDFLTRPYVAGGPSKLWRDYPGLIPSQELVTAMVALVDHYYSDQVTPLRQTIQQMQKAFQSCVEHHPDDAEHITKSLEKMAFMAPGFENSPILQTYSERIELVFNHIEIQIAINIPDMEQAANLMTLQLNIDQAINSDTPEKTLEQLREHFKANRSSYPHAPMTWFNTNAFERPFTGGFKQFVAYRKQKIRALNENEYDKASLDLSPIEKLQQDIDQAILAQSWDALTQFSFAMRFIEMEIPPKKRMDNMAIAWPPTQDGQRSFHGNFDDYVKHRQAALSNQVTFTINHESYQYVTDFPEGAIYQKQHQEHTQQCMVKAHSPGRCLAEGLAICYDPLNRDFSRIPHTILADAYQTKKGSQTIAISVQPIFGEASKSLHELSTGLRQEANIATQLQHMSHEVKQQLAYAIYTSQLNGDENLHPHNLICTFGRGGQISNITRIHLESIGRHTRPLVFNPMKTSPAFGSSGLFSTDYIACYLKDQTIREQLITLWQQTNVQKVAQLVSEKFEQQLKQLGDSTLQQTALSELHDRLNPDTPALQGALTAQIQTVARELNDLTVTRCTQMRQGACFYQIERLLVSYAATSADQSIKQTCINLSRHLQNPELSYAQKQEDIHQARLPPALADQCRTILASPQPMIASPSSMFKPSPPPPGAPNVPPPFHRSVFSGKRE